MREAHTQSGFTLLETVVAIGLILFGVLSMMLLSLVTLYAGRNSEDEFLATQFAQEGIEVVRSIRDSNWLAYDSDSTTLWNAGLYADGVEGPIYTAVIFAEDLSAGRTLQFFVPAETGGGCFDLADEILSYDCEAIWYDDGLKFYNQGATSEFNPNIYTATPFSRIIKLYPVCRNITTNAEQIITSGQCTDLGSTFTQVGIDSVVEIRWSSRFGQRTYILEEKLYNWKYEQ